MDGTTLVERPSQGLHGPLARPGGTRRGSCFGRRWSRPRRSRAATTVAFPGLVGVVPGVGRFDPCDWGLGLELHDGKSPHWMGRANSPATFGHFGGAGTFVWVDPVADVALVALTDRDFGPWALEAWPRFADAVLGGRGRASRPPRQGARHGDRAGIRRLGNGLVNSYLVEAGGEVTIVDAGAPSYWGDLPAELAAMGRSLDGRPGGRADPRPLRPHRVRRADPARTRRRRSSSTSSTRPWRGARSRTRPRVSGRSRSAVLEFLLFSATHGALRVPPDHRGLHLRRRRDPGRARLAAGDPASPATRRAAPRSISRTTTRCSSATPSRRTASRPAGAARRSRRSPRIRPRRSRPSRGSTASRRSSSCRGTARRGPAASQPRWPRPVLCSRRLTARYHPGMDYGLCLPNFPAGASPGGDRCRGRGRRAARDVRPSGRPTTSSSRVAAADYGRIYEAILTLAWVGARHPRVRLGDERDRRPAAQRDPSRQGAGDARFAERRPGDRGRRHRLE